MYLIVWQFRCRDGQTREFEAAYGPAGAWTQLFRRASGFLGTELVRSLEEPSDYLTLDRWDTATDFEAFKVQWAADYHALDERCAGLTDGEIRLGAFTTTER